MPRLALPWRWLAALLLMLALPTAAPLAADFAVVRPGLALSFPADFGAHPAYRTEWWYATGWLQDEAGKPLGFQVTFFRSATGQGAHNPSRFAPRQLIVGHAALSDPALGRLAHEQKSAREGMGLAYAREGNTELKLDDWSLVRGADGSYRAVVQSREFSMQLRLAPTQPVMPQGERGFSRKGPAPQQASYYYSEPHLQVSGSVLRHGKRVKVSGSAWLDHEWSSSVLAEGAAGWDWVGANLDDGAALMAFRIRGKDGATLWSHASLREASGKTRLFAPAEVSFIPQRRWRSPRTGVDYPVALTLRTGPLEWQLSPLQDDQELDSRASTGAIYWEGAVRLTRDGKSAGRGYLELTGYHQPMKL